MKLTFDGLKDEYAALWASLETRPSKAADIEATASKILGKKTRYRAVEKDTGVPWYVVGLIHAMEGGCNFATHLHNGDPLSARTRQVPAGRPKAGTPPFSWKESACDALTMKGLQDVTDWSIERIAFELERYNGHGYRKYHPTVLSPYLWSGTNHYSRGKYVADGKWSATAVSGQSGAMAILKRMMEMDAEVCPMLAGETDVREPADIEERVTNPAEAFPRTPEPRPAATARVIAESRSIWAGLMGLLSIIVGVVTDLAKSGWEWLGWLVGIAPTIAKEAREALTPMQEMWGWFGVQIPRVLTAMAVVCIVVFVVRHAMLRVEAKG